MKSSFFYSFNNSHSLECTNTHHVLVIDYGYSKASLVIYAAFEE